MEKILMHLDTPVAMYSCQKNGDFQALKEVYNEKLLPDRTREYDIALRRWLLLRRRSSQIREFSQARNFYGAEYFKSENLRSMYDTYWIKESKDEDTTWEEVNPHENWDSSIDSIFMLLYYPQEFEGYDESSPNLTIPGVEPLVWYDSDGVIGLINQDSQQDMEAYRLSLKNGIKSVAKREYKIIAGRVFSFRKASTSEKIERIPFDVFYNEFKDDSLSKIQNIKNCCDNYGITGWETFTQDIVGYSQLVPQKTIELSDIGILRRTDTLECIGFDQL